MALDNNSNSLGWKDIPKLLVIVLGISVICLMFPSHEMSNYDYKIGQKWAYEDLTAREDFTAILSISQQIEDRDTIINSSVKYQRGGIIVANGQYITNALQQTIDQYLTRENSQKFGILSSRGLIYFLGYFLLTTLIIGAMIVYAAKFFPESCKTLPRLSFSSCGRLYLVSWSI